MAVIYNVAVKTARMTATRDYFAGGSLELLSASSQVLAIFNLTSGGGTVSGDTWTLAVTASTVAGQAAAGAGTTATQARIKNSGGNAHITGLTVGLSDSAADLKMTNTSITTGQDVTLSSGSIQHA